MNPAATTRGPSKIRGSILVEIRFFHWRSCRISDPRRPAARRSRAGILNDRPIPAAVVDYFGRRYIYAGIAPRRHNGQYDVEALAIGERLVEPGLVYRSEEIHKKVA